MESSGSYHDRRSESTKVVGNVPHAPVGAALLGGEPRRQDARTARPTKALHSMRPSENLG